MHANRAVLATAAVLLGAGCGSSTPAPITVSGRIVPVPPAPVTLMIGSQLTTSDAATGAFTFSRVQPPYDLAMKASATMAIVYQGLTRPDPVVHGYYGLLIGIPVTYVRGVITGSGIQQNTTDYRAKTAWGSPEASSDADANIVAQLSFDQGVAWKAPPDSTTGTIHALQWKKTSATDPSPASYTGYGKKTGVTIASGVDLSGQEVVTAPVMGIHLQGTASGPSGYALQALRVDLAFPDRARMRVIDMGVSPGAFDFLMPSLDGVTARIELEARKGANESTSARWTGLALDATGVSLSLRSAPAPNAPADAATGVTTSSTFSWEPYPGGVHLVGFGANAPGAPGYSIFTTRSSTTLPDLTPLGMALPPSVAYTWRVMGYGPFASVDAIAEAAVIESGFAPAGSDSFEAASAPRTFTTAPAP